MTKTAREISIGVVVTVVGGVLLNQFTSFSIISAFNWFIEFLKACISVISESNSIPNWLLGVFILLSSIPIIWLTWHFRNRSLAPSYRDYVEDKFEGVTWRWSYDYSGGIVKPWCYCPNCDTSLVYREDEDAGWEYSTGRVHTVFVCERCGGDKGRIEGRKDYAISRIVRFIDRSIRVGDWKTIIQNRK